MSNAVKAVVVVVLVMGAGFARTQAPARTTHAGLPELSDARRAAGLTYAPSVDGASRALVQKAIGLARPEAQRLIAAVDGLTEIQVATPLGGALGTTEGAGDHFEVALDLGAGLRAGGERGAARLVLHELGHVVDFALVPDDLKRELDAGIPAGAPCPPGENIASCAAREERFAETFAKWAMGNDLGANLYIGYAVPPPPSFDAWAAPLVRLAD
jgi:hypothetical protein